MDPQLRQNVQLSTPSQRMFSFAEIVKGRDATVRVSDDGLLFAVDLAMAMTGLARDQAGLVLRRLSEEIFPSIKLIKRKMPGKGNAHTKLVSFQDAIELIMVLPGKVAKATRKQFVDIIVRYLDGDESMCQEIKNNKSIGRIQSYGAFCMTMVANVQEKLKRKFPSTGYIYATKSPAFPGLVKIGRTENVFNRLIQLNTSCAPAPHVLIAMAPTFNMSRDERTAHAFFSGVREKGEFFRIPDELVISYFATHVAVQYNLELSSMT